MFTQTVVDFMSGEVIDHKNDEHGPTSGIRCEWSGTLMDGLVLAIL